MKFTTVLCVTASIAAQDYHNQPQQYDKPQQDYQYQQHDNRQYQHQPQYREPYHEPQHDYQKDYVRDDYQPRDKDYAPTKAYKKKSYEDESKENFDQFWNNLVLCDAEYDLYSCLLDCNDRHTFFNEKRIADCTVKFVSGLCGTLKATKSKCDNGYIKLDEDNCPTAGFADSLLVFNKMVTDLNSALGVTPSYDPWVYTTIQMAITATRSNADCVITSFFNFLNQCATSNYISSHDIQCVEKHLSDSNCGFAAEDPEGWNLPYLIERYGLAGAEKVISKLKHGYGYKKDEEVIPALQKVLESIADEDAHGIHSVTTAYDYHTTRSSVNVCPQNWISMNENFATDGSEAIPLEAVAFHFPANGTAEFESAEVPLDPITDHTIYNTCEKYFEATKEIYNASADVNPGDICVSINGYDLHFIESDQTVPLYYEEIDFTSGSEQCYKASWDEAKSCSSHLTEWQMSVACCKSYASVVADNAPKKHDKYDQYSEYGYELLDEEEPQYYDRQYQQQQSYQQQQQYHEPQPYHQQQQQYHEPQPYYHKPAVAKISRKALVFEHVVKSNSNEGSLARIDDADAVAGTIPQRVVAGFDRLNAELKDKCESIDFTKIYKYGALYYLQKFCEGVAHTADAIEAHDNPSDLLSAGRYDAPHVEVEYKVKKHPYYVGESYASKMTCSTLEIHLDFNSIVPLVSDQCFPQACVLSQLASCMEIPEKEYSSYGYDYVNEPYGNSNSQYYHEQQQYHEPAHHSSGYGSSSYGYQALLAAKAGQGSVAAFASIGFVAGVAVIAIAQAVINQRRSANNQQLV